MNERGVIACVVLVWDVDGQVIMVGIFSRLFKLFLSLDGLSIKQRWTIAMDVLVSCCFFRDDSLLVNVVVIVFS